MSSLSKKNELLLRVYLVMFAFVIFAGIIAFKIISISLIDGDYWKQKKEKRYMEWRPIPTQRGDIYADDGQSLLATSVEFFEIRMDPVAPSEKDFYDNIDALARSLAKFPGKYSGTQWKSMIAGARKAYLQKSKGGSRNLLIAEQVDMDGLDLLKSYPLFKLGQYRGGIIKIKEYVRKKPYQELASRTIGELRNDNMVGLENSFNEQLKGEEKKAYMQLLPGKLYVPVYDPTEFEIIKGKDIVTTLNMHLQDVVHNELYKGLVENNAEAAVAVLMEVETGRIKAMSNLSRNKNGEIGEFHNLAFADRSEPGSTIKAASVLALLEDGFAKSETVVDFSKGKKKFWDRWMHDSGEHGLSYGSLKMALEKSSNVAIAGVMQDKYGSVDKRMLYYEKMMQFGFDAPTGLGLDGEPTPYIKHPQKDKKIWYGTTIPWMAHGYELSMTPLQILNFYNAVANGGRLMQPQLVKAVMSNDQVEKEFPPIVKRQQIARADNIKELQKMLEGVVERGTAAGLRTDRYDFAGKTGTTKVGYDKGEIKYNASFCGYWPAQNPKYSMIVVVYGLKGAKYYGTVVAGPIFKRIMDWSFALQDGSVAMNETIHQNGRSEIGGYNGEVFGYGEDYKEIFEDVKVDYLDAGRWIKGGNDEKGKVLTGKAKISTDRVPELEGMGVRDAVYVLENLGLRVRLEGAGHVVRQSLKSGTLIDNQEITLYLN